MKSDGSTKEIPLVVKYKSRVPVYDPPSKDIYRFKYSYTFKGAPKAPEKAPTGGKAAPAGGKGAPAGGKGAPVQQDETLIEKIEDAVGVEHGTVENLVGGVGA